MAFRISKTARAGIDEALTAFAKAGTDLESAVSGYNDAREQHWAEIDTAQSAYNDARQQVIDLLEAEADQAQSEYDDKSEKWQEGDKASAVSEWIDHLRAVVADDVEEAQIDEPPEIEVSVYAEGGVEIQDAPEE